MGKYQEDARELLAAVGGRGEHCSVCRTVSPGCALCSTTRPKADVPRIEKNQIGPKGTFTQAGQFQVIIGNTVNDFYNDFVAVSGIERASRRTTPSRARPNRTRTAPQKVMSALAEIFAPLIPIMITGGLILGFRNLHRQYVPAGERHQDPGRGQPVFWSGVDSFPVVLYRLMSHLPYAAVCASAGRVTKKDGHHREPWALCWALTLVSGQLLNAYSVATTAASRHPPKWDFGFVQVEHDRLPGPGVIPRHAGGLHSWSTLKSSYRKICPAVDLDDRGALLQPGAVG